MFYFLVLVNTLSLVSNNNNNFFLISQIIIIDYRVSVHNILKKKITCFRDMTLGCYGKYGDHELVEIRIDN